MCSVYIFYNCLRRAVHFEQINLRLFWNTPFLFKPLKTCVAVVPILHITAEQKHRCCWLNWEWSGSRCRFHFFLVNCFQILWPFNLRETLRWSTHSARLNSRDIVDRPFLPQLCINQSPSTHPQFHALYWRQTTQTVVEGKHPTPSFPLFVSFIGGPLHL